MRDKSITVEVVQCDKEDGTLIPNTYVVHIDVNCTSEEITEDKAEEEKQRIETLLKQL